MYIDLKLPELTVLRLHGYTVRQTGAFVLAEALFLYLIGFIPGGLLGGILAELCNRIMKAELSVSVWLPCLAAVLTAAVFTCMLRRIVLRRNQKSSRQINVHYND